MKQKTYSAKYKIPEWCAMATQDHKDGLGGCWGIFKGYTDTYGKQYCDKSKKHEACEYFKPKRRRVKQ